MAFQKVIFGVLEHFWLGQLSAGTLFIHPALLSKPWLFTLYHKTEQGRDYKIINYVHSTNSSHLLEHRVKHPAPSPEIRGVITSREAGFPLWQGDSGPMCCCSCTAVPCALPRRTTGARVSMAARTAPAPHGSVRSGPVRAARRWERGRYGNEGISARGTRYRDL